MSRKESGGFSVIEALIALVVIAVIGLGGWMVWRHSHQQKKAAATKTAAPSADKKTSDMQSADPYAGWKSYCDTELKACYKYPNDWVRSQYGGWQNAADTAYFNLVGSNKDQATDDVYIAAIEDLANTGEGLKVVGFVKGNIPTYVVYEESVVSGQHLAVGQTVQLVTVNPTFSGKGVGKDLTFSATPGAKGIAAITTPEQAKSWFATPEARQCLRILQSFNYQ